MLTQTVFQHVLELDLVIGSTVQTLKEGVDFINEANNENPDSKLVKLIELHEKTIQCLEELHYVATNYITE